MRESILFLIKWGDKGWLPLKIHGKAKEGGLEYMSKDMDRFIYRQKVGEVK